jgi:hypothetical protein
MIMREVRASINFWEARQAALEGKTVKRLIAEDEFCNYDSKDFLTRSMAPYEVSGHWEMVEETKHETGYINIYSGNSYTWGIHPRKADADNNAKLSRIGTIAITVDENGKLVKAENV